MCWIWTLVSLCVWGGGRGIPDFQGSIGVTLAVGSETDPVVRTCQLSCTSVSDLARLNGGYLGCSRWDSVPLVSYTMGLGVWGREAGFPFTLWVTQNLLYRRFSGCFSCQPGAATEQCSWLTCLGCPGWFYFSLSLLTRCQVWNWAVSLIFLIWLEGKT